MKIKNNPVNFSLSPLRITEMVYLKVGRFADLK
jgi:hypothetical protein